MSIQKTPHPKTLRYLKFVNGRVQGLDDKQIAAGLGFCQPQELYRRLASDGYPVCAVCGAEHVGEKHCEEPGIERKARRAGGEAVELPPASRAAGLFEAALEQLRRDLGAIERIAEWYKDGRFEVERVVPGTDEGGEAVHVIVLEGAAYAPSEFETRLIAAYALSGLSIKALVTALHPEPESADLEKLGQNIHGYTTEGGNAVAGLETKARHVARLVRGGTLGKGRNPAEISPVEQEVVVYVRNRREEGASDEKILEELREGYGLTHSRFAGPEGETTLHPWPDIEMEDLERLGNLGAWREP